MPLQRKKFFYFIGLFLIVLSGMDCSRKAGRSQGDEFMPPRPIEAVLKEHTDKLMAVSGVVGTAQGLCDDKPCIKVYVAALTPELKKKIPKSLEGYLVDVEVTGEFRALPKR